MVQQSRRESREGHASQNLSASRTPPPQCPDLLQPKLLTPCAACGKRIPPGHRSSKQLPSVKGLRGVKFCFLFSFDPIPVGLRHAERLRRPAVKLKNKKQSLSPRSRDERWAILRNERQSAQLLDVIAIRKSVVPDTSQSFQSF